MQIYALADRLHKTVAEVLAMPMSEIQGWHAYAVYMDRVKQGERERLTGRE